MKTDNDCPRPLYKRFEGPNGKKARDTCDIAEFLAVETPTTRQELADLQMAISERKTAGHYASFEMPRPSHTGLYVYGASIMLYLDLSEKPKLLRAIDEMRLPEVQHDLAGVPQVVE
jgi:hypothetical protein